MQPQRNALDQVSFLKEKSGDVVSKIKKMLASGEIKQRDIVSYSGYSAGVISLFLDGSYTGDVNAIEDIIIRYYRKWIVEQMIVDNSLVKQMRMYLNLIYKKRLMGKVTAPFGAGKSVASAHFATINQDFAAYVELPSTTTSASIINRIANSLGKELSGSKDDRLTSIIRELSRGSKLLIIDEADNLNPRSLAVLKDIYGSKASQRCGIAFVGTDKLDRVMMDPGLGYLRSRISIDVQLKPIAFDEAKEIADLWVHDLDDEELKDAWLWASQGHGGLRGFTNLIERADDMAQALKYKKIDSECLIRAYALVDKNEVKKDQKKK